MVDPNYVVMLRLKNICPGKSEPFRGQAGILSRSVISFSALQRGMPLPTFRKMFSEAVLEHFRNPRNAGDSRCYCHR